jgi:hypothetical protein
MFCSLVNYFNTLYQSLQEQISAAFIRNDLASAFERCLPSDIVLTCMGQGSKNESIADGLMSVMIS